MNTLETLNNIYSKLHEEKNQITDYLTENDIPHNVAYFPFHSFKQDDEFYLEQYPIPVIQVMNKIDVGIDTDKVFFEFRFLREAALEFDFKVFEMFDFEVYGIEDYYDDFYFDNIEEIHTNIMNSTEEEIAISILITKDNLLEDTITIIDLLEHLL